MKVGKDLVTPNTCANPDIFLKGGGGGPYENEHVLQYYFLFFIFYIFPLFMLNFYFFLTFVVKKNVPADYNANKRSTALPVTWRNFVTLYFWYRLRHEKTWSDL